jgi:heme A synthase
MVQIHNTLSNMIGIYSLVLGVWGLFNFARRNPPDGSYNGALVLAVALYAIEGIVGIVLLLMGLTPARGIHFLYGVTILLTIPAIFFFTRGSNTTRESLLYGLGMLFIWGLSDRAAFTGLVPGE